MRFTEIECSLAVAEKLWAKHQIDLAEVDELLTGDAWLRRGRGGLYYILGRTEAGRYLFAVFRDLGGGNARLVTAREMDKAERRAYQRR